LEEGRGGRKRLPLSIPAILTDYNIYWPTEHHSKQRQPTE
jgi:hypothetical protein